MVSLASFPPNVKITVWEGHSDSGSVIRWDISSTVKHFRFFISYSGFNSQCKKYIHIPIKQGIWSDVTIIQEIMKKSTVCDCLSNCLPFSRAVYFKGAVQRISMTKGRSSVLIGISQISANCKLLCSVLFICKSKSEVYLAKTLK